MSSGTKLVQLDIAVELADLASAKATLREAEVAFERQADLIAEARHLGGEPRYRAGQARHRAGGREAHPGRHRPEGHRRPFAGRLGIRKVEKGQYVSAGMALVSLQALDPIRADFPMPEQHIGKLRVGQPIELTVDAFPGQVFKGEIQSLDARVAQDTRTLLVRGILPNRSASCCRACSPT